jgi:hypothetical protein
VNLLPEFIDPMKTSMRTAILVGNMVAVVGKLLARIQAGRLTHDLVALNHEA